MEYKLATTSWGVEELEALNRVISSGVFSMGKEVREFESQFADYFNSKFAVMCSSGSTANLLMIAALFFKKQNPLKKGDEVIVPAVSWSTTYFPLQQYGLKVKFIDIDLETLNFDLDKLEEAVTDKTKVVLAVNLLGNSNNFERINEIIKGKDIVLLEDNCESMGAKFNGKFCGTFGLMGTFSLFFSHHISTMEGGMILTENEEIFHILLSLRAHGWTRNLPKENLVSNKCDDEFEESYRFVLPGYNVRPLEMSGAIGQEQLKKLNSFVDQRRLNANYFFELFSNDKRFIIQKEIGQSSWFGFSLIVKPGSSLKRKDLIEKLKSGNVEYRPIVAGNFTQNEVMKYFDFEIHHELINAKYLHKNGLFVGNSQEPLYEQIKHLHYILD